MLGGETEQESYLLNTYYDSVFNGRLKIYIKTRALSRTEAYCHFPVLTNDRQKIQSWGPKPADN